MIMGLFLDEYLLNYGIEKYTLWNPATAPHIVIFGATGTGKTYATKLMLGRIAKNYSCLLYTSPSPRDCS